MNISWDSPGDTEEFILQINNNMNFNNTIRSIENSVIMLLPYGTYSATLCTVNGCGKTCQDYGRISIVERRQETTLIPKPQQETTLIPEPAQETCIGEDNTIMNNMCLW